jgi:hypothetical protein
METFCLGHITGECKDCTPDEHNKKCPTYHPVALAVVEVKERPEKKPKRKRSFL